jgi:DNA-binding FrmR family transcriptional regulator
MIEEDLYCIDVLTQVNAARRDWRASRCSCSALTPSTV